MTDFSSHGPTDDGRVKPDLVGNGNSLLSTDDGFDWRVTIGPYSDDLLPVAESAVQPYVVNVEVFWEEGGAAQTLSLESMLLGPVPS